MNIITLLATPKFGGLLRQVEIVGADEEAEQVIWVEALRIKGFEHLIKPLLLSTFHGFVGTSGVPLTVFDFVAVDLSSEMSLDKLKLQLRMKNVRAHV